MADIKIAGRIKAGAADNIAGYASEILFDDAASNKTVKEKIEEAASSPQTMIVTISPDGNDGYEADKTFAEIKEFIDNGGTVIAKDEEDGDSYYYLDNYIASEVVFTRNIWGSGGFSTRSYTIDNTNTVSFIDSAHHISSAVDSSSTANLANSAAVKAVKNEVDTKQNALTFDNVPTANSSNPVKSGGVYQAIQSIDVSSQISGKEDKSNKVTSFSSPTDTQYPSAKLVNDQLATKQGTISDLSTIRSGAAAGATAVQPAAMNTALAAKVNSDDVYTKAQVDDMIEYVAHWGDTVGNVTVADFNAQTDTVWNKTQVLSAAQQAQARTNIGAGTVSSVTVNGTTYNPTNGDVNLGTIGGGGGSGEANVIESISINGTAQTVTSKNVDLAVPTSSTITAIVTLTEAQYTALATKDSSTLYIITA